MLSLQTMSHKPGWMNEIEEMDDLEFQRWSRLLKQRTGMEIRNSRKSFLSTGIRLRMRELGFNSYNQYYHHLLSGREGKVEWTTLVDRLTIHETRFYRHASSIEILTERFLPGYLKANAEKRHIQAWSVGCATGEESYTLAMVLDDYLQRHHTRAYYGVVGSDISLPALATARKGIYDARRIKLLPTPLQQHYLTPLEDGRYAVKETLRKRVCFNMINLLEMEDSVSHEMDIIFCQNVLIYFDTPLRHTILNKLIENLSPGGLLVIGVGEALEWKHPQMKRLVGIDALAYTKESLDG